MPTTRKRTNRAKRSAVHAIEAFGAAAGVMLLATSAHAQSPGIAGVVAPGVEPELVQEGFVFTEGPLGPSDGGRYFPDSRPNRIDRRDPSGENDLVRVNPIGADCLAFRRD